MSSSCPNKFQNGLCSIPVFSCSNHASALGPGPMFGDLIMTFSTTEFHGQTPSMSWKFGSDLRIIVHSLEIILCSCEFLSLYATHPLEIFGLSAFSSRAQPKGDHLSTLSGYSSKDSSRHKARPLPAVPFQYPHIQGRLRWN